MFTKLLIANRGEIACRIIKSARRLGIQTVAIYSSADKHSQHVILADDAWFIGDAPASMSYLNIDAIMKAAMSSGAQAIHPGYGFLSENADFAHACERAGIVFVGPSTHAMTIMASKQLAKQLLEKTDVPLTPGYHGSDQSDERLLDEATRLGFPVLLKAALGGGGKGMRTASQPSDFQTALAGARREAMACFGDDTLLLEKLIQHPRHVEIQLMADNHGQIVHLFERDCSIQRRHQKIVEEAPAPNLPMPLRAALAEAAITVARAIDYRGAGTVEFLVENNERFYFMEMNTRLQVEHPVSEMITEFDFVEWQLRIAANEPIPRTQPDIRSQGHAIECRIYAEDPDQGFVPSIGQLSVYEEPTFEGIRVDSGVVNGDVISRYYDPMFAKIIAWGITREQAILRMQQALANTSIGGIKTNIPFLQAILNHPAFITGQLSTDFLTQQTLNIQKPNPEHAVLIAAGMDYLQYTAQTHPVIADTMGWQMHLPTRWPRHYHVNGDEYIVTITPLNHHSLTIDLNGKSRTLDLAQMGDYLSMNDGTQSLCYRIEVIKNTFRIYTHQGPVTVVRIEQRNTDATTHQQNHDLRAPMPATIVALLKQTGDLVLAGEGLVVLEAMKMEHTVHAPRAGRLTDFFFPLGAQVNEGALLAALSPIEQGK